MVNTPATIQQSATAYCLGHRCTPSDAILAEQLINCIGPVALQVPENQLNAVTGLSGSGPAFVFTFIEAMADAGVSQGLSRETALALAAQTVAGAGQMLLRSGEHPAVLKDSVCSPGETTITGVLSLESTGFRNSVINAVVAAARKSSEL